MNVTPIVKQYKQVIINFMTQLEEQLSPHNETHIQTVRRAIFIVRNQAIEAEAYYPAYSKLYFNISETAPANVAINFAAEDVVCTCVNAYPCHHAVAAMMSLYQYHHSLQTWVTNWRASKHSQFDLLSDQRTPAAWRNIASSVLKQMMPRNQIEPYLLSSIDAKIHERLKASMPYEREWQALYKFYMELFVLHELFDYIDPTSTSHRVMFSYFFARKEERLVTLMYELREQMSLFQMDSFFISIEEMLHSFLLTRQGFAIERFTIYCYYWSHVQCNNKMRLQEVARLMQSTHDTEFAQLFFAMLSRDEARILATTAHSPEHCGYYVTMARTVLAPHDSYVHLLKLALPDLHTYTHQHIAAPLRQMHAEEMMKLYSEVPLTETEEQTFYYALGVHGIQFYASSLIQQQRYREWVALQMLHATSVTHAEMYGLKDVLAHDPSLVLPLYHLFAMREIEQKSRPHYKQAVRIWKMMKSAAKKANKQSYFERYIETMQLQFKRLRALQQEMEKGKLLT